MTNYEIERERIISSCNETLRGLFERKSVRAFDDRQISEEDKRTILYAASEAPSAGCQQLYTIIDVTDQKIKDMLAVSCDNQPFIAKAPMVLVFCTDCKKWYDAYIEAGYDARKPGAGDFLLALEDTAIAAQNAVCAAWSMGIGSCYIGDILENCERQREILKIPEYVVPSVLLVLGYPTEQQKNRKKPVRSELDGIVYENSYPENMDVRAVFENRHGNESFDEWMIKFCKRKYESDFSREMTRSCEEILKQFS